MFPTITSLNKILLSNLMNLFITTSWEELRLFSDFDSELFLCSKAILLLVMFLLAGCCSILAASGLGFVYFHCVLTNFLQLPTYYYLITIISSHTSASFKWVLIKIIIYCCYWETFQALDNIILMYAFPQTTNLPCFCQYI